MSALPPKADITREIAEVRFGQKGALSTQQFSGCCVCRCGSEEPRAGKRARLGLWPD
jgi:hypothetical protein